MPIFSTGKSRACIYIDWDNIQVSIINIPAFLRGIQTFIHDTKVHESYSTYVFVHNKVSTAVKDALRENGANIILIIKDKAKSGDEESADKAEEILRHMEDIFETEENIDARPNVRSFNSVINAWAKSRKPEAAWKAQDMLDLMESLYDQGNKAVRPDAHSFCTVINGKIIKTILVL